MQQLLSLQRIFIPSKSAKNSTKLHFPDNASGRWRVEVRTAKEQIIGVLRFNVIER